MPGQWAGARGGGGFSYPEGQLQTRGSWCTMVVGRAEGGSGVPRSSCVWLEEAEVWRREVR